MGSAQILGGDYLEAELVIEKRAELVYWDLELVSWESK